MFTCCIRCITVYTSIRVVSLAALSSMAVLGLITLTPPGASATAGLSLRRHYISVLHFLGVLRKSRSCYHFELRYRTDDIHECICIYVCVIHYTPWPCFYCVHKPHYQLYCVHNNVLQHVLCIWWHHVLLYFVKNDENKDAQSINLSHVFGYYNFKIHISHGSMG